MPAGAVIRGLGFCALPAVLLLGSATRPTMLAYDWGGLVGPSCTRKVDCAALFDPTRALAAEQARAALEQAEAVAAGLKLVVSIPQQTLYMFREGELLGTSPVSTGKRGHATPVGTFRILQKHIDHRSNRYANAPMPYMQRLTNSGVALHAGRVRGYPASHGCIRLPLSFAKRLYGMTSWTTRVTVTRARPVSADQALALAQPDAA